MSPCVLLVPATADRDEVYNTVSLSLFQSVSLFFPYISLFPSHTHTLSHTHTHTHTPPPPPPPPNSIIPTKGYIIKDRPPTMCNQIIHCQLQQQHRQLHSVHLFLSFGSLLYCNNKQPTEVQTVNTEHIGLL